MENITLSFIMNPENSDYIVIDFDEYFKFFSNKRNAISPELYRYIDGLTTTKLYNAHSKDIKFINIKKDSPLALFLTSEVSDDIINKSKTISSTDIENAMQVAIYDGNPISKELFFLIEKGISGSIDELKHILSQNTLNYIIKHKHFEESMQKKRGTYQPKVWFVYENNAITKKILYQNNKQENAQKNYTWKYEGRYPVRVPNIESYA